MKKKNLLLTYLLAALILGGGVKNSTWAATEIDGIFYNFSGSGSSRRASVTYQTSSYNSYSGDVVIPSTVNYNNNDYPVTNIGMHAFDLCSGLTSVTISESVVAIEMYAFKDCTGLTSIDIPSSVTSIGSNAFLNCTALTSINGQSSVTSISANAFKGCTNLESITVLGDITEIPMSTFEGCSSLPSIPIPNSVSAIRGTAFKDCTGLTSITIPSSITTIGGNAFQGCTGLTEINYNVTTHSDFSSSTLPFKGCDSNATINIGFNVTTIPAYAFSGINVTEVTIPSAVTNIGNNAFGNYTKLSTVYMLGTNPPTLANNSVFKTSYYNYANIKVLSSSDESILNVYKAANYWSDFSSNISETDNFTVTNMDLTGISTPVTIPSGNTITVTGTATNPTTANLVIADGGQLITNNPVNATLQKGINAAAVWGAPGADAWYFIASPVDGYETSNVIITGNNDTDLYSFDEESGYWFNGQGTEHPFTTLTRGQGYLYANSTGTDLSFLGTMPATNTNIEKTLGFVGSGDLKGFNLMGNPFTCNLTSDNVKIQDGETLTSLTTYYIVENGTELTTTDLSINPIKPGRGFLIQADKEGQKLVFNPGAKRGETINNPSFIRIEAGDEDFMDRAYVQFGQGNTLRKMTINDNVSHVYVMNEGKDYAAATIQEAQGEMPVNFKARHDGQYTITVNPQEVEMDYLHLIDNIAGVDVDLLALRPFEGPQGPQAQGPASYTFTAKADDYESRFRLVFSANETNTDLADDFAFISNGEIVINGTGTVQIVDMMGRVVSTRGTEERISTNGMTPGVYVLRLVGENVKTQKIVVR